IAFTQAVITPRVAKRFKNYQVLRVSMLAVGFGLLANLWAHNTAQLLMVTPLFAIFVGQTIANTTALVSKSVGPEIQGEVLGINFSVQALAQAIPAAMSGYIAKIGVTTPITVGAAFVMLGGILFILIYRPSKNIMHDAQPGAAVSH